MVGLKGLLGKYHLSKSKVVSLKFHSASYLQRNPVRNKVMEILTAQVAEVGNAGGNGNLATM